MDERYSVRWDWSSSTYMVFDEFAGAPSGLARYDTPSEAQEAANNLEASRVS